MVALVPILSWVRRNTLDTYNSIFCSLLHGMKRPTLPEFSDLHVIAYENRTLLDELVMGRKRLLIRLRLVMSHMVQISPAYSVTQS